MLRPPLRTITIGLLAPAALAACLSYSPHEVPFSGRSLRAESLAALESRPAPARLRFAVVGDVQGWYDEAWDAVRLLNGMEDLAFVVQAGDFTDLGRSYEYGRMAEIFEALAAPWFAVVGNHDLLGNGGVIFDELLGPRNSDFTCARTRFVLLDTNSREYGFGGRVPDLAWLETRLGPSPDHDRIVVISHVAPWSADFDPALRDGFVSQLGRAGVALSIHAHEHSYAARAYEGVPYFVADAVVNRTLLLVEGTPSEGFDVRRMPF